MLFSGRTLGIDYLPPSRSRVRSIQHLLLFLCFMEAVMVISSVVNRHEATSSSAPRPSVPLRNRQMHAPPVQINLGQSNKVLKKRRKAISCPEALLFVRQELFTSVFFTMLDTCTAPLVLFILLLRGGIEPNPGPCSCSFATLPGASNIQCRTGSFLSKSGVRGLFGQTDEPLINCDADTTSYLNSIFHYSFGIKVPGPDEFPKREWQLIAWRIGKFTMTELEASQMRICFAHRKALGMQMDTTKSCVMPGHSGRLKRPTRNVSFEMAKQLTESLHYPVPVAAKICETCRRREWHTKRQPAEAMDTSEKPDPVAMETEHLDDQPSTSRDKDESDHDTHQPESFAEVLISQHRPERKAVAATRERVATPQVVRADTSKQLKNFNDAMTNLSASMVDEQLPRPATFTHRLTKPLADYAARTQRKIRKCATTAIIAVLDNISPGGAAELWTALLADHAVEQELGMDDAMQPAMNDASLATVAQIYLSATTRQMQLQILSILVGLGPKSAVLRHIPNLSHRQYWNAIRYKRRVGPGIPVGTKKIKRVRVSYEQIEHFVMFMTRPEYMQDVAFGCRMIKYESGIKQEVPNTVRTLCTSRLIAHYRNYCKTSNHPLPIPSNTTLYKLMSVVGGKQLKSLQGLDNIQADGMEGFATLHKTLKEIEALGFESIYSNSVDKTRTRLTNFKRYLQLDYHCHIEQSNTPCTTHCPSFALSEDADTNEFKTLCTDHEHHLVCDRCMDFPLLEDEFQQLLAQIPDVEHLRETKDVLSHNVLKSFEQIADYRSHIIRYHNQNRAKLDILRNLQPDECYCLADYAMKWLPKKFFERQKDYFGRRGISWHFTCMVTRCEKDGDFDIHCFAHILGSSPQNWFSVASALEHSMEWLKGIKPHITKIYFRSDRASNYHSTHLISCLPDICERQGFTAMAYHFSEPQTGKDLADRKIAGAKAHAQRYLNEQHDIETAAELFTALTSSGGVRGCYVANSEVQHSENNFQNSTISWPNFNSYSNFIYNGDEITAFKSYNVGTGKKFSRQSFLNNKKLKPTALSIISTAEPSTEKGKTGFIAKYKKSHKDKPVNEKPVSEKPVSESEAGPVTPTATSVYSDSTKEPETDPSQAVGAESDDLPQIADEVLYNCTEPECCSTFGSQEALDQHLDQGEHQIELQLHSIYDTARAIYVDKLTELKEEYGTTIQRLYPGYYQERPQESMGWALPGKRKIVRKTPKVKEWLKKVFTEGLKKNIKKSGAEVAKLMKQIRNDDGSLFFAPNEWLDKDRITAYFNGLHAINMNLLKEDTFDQAQKDDEDQVIEDAVPTTTEAQAELQAANYAVAEEELAVEVHSEVGLQHPVTFREIDLCHHRLNNTLHSLQNAILYAAIEEFGETIAKRSNKEQLTSKLNQILLGCSCNTKSR